MGVEPTSSAWKADVLAVVRHLRTGCDLYYITAPCRMQAFFCALLWQAFTLYFRAGRCYNYTVLQIFRGAVLLDKRYKGVFYIILSAFFFALMALLVRLAGDLPAVQKSFFRNLVALFFAAAVLAKKRPAVKMAKADWWYMFLRSGFGTLGVLCNFYAVDHLLLADASMLNKMSPFFAIVLSALLLKEKLTPFQLGAVAAAFCGVLLVVKPTGQNMTLAPALIGLLGGFGAGFAYTMVHLLGTRGVPGPFIVFCFSLFSCVVTGPMMLADFVPMTAAQLGVLLLVGLSAAFAQFSITAAYTCAPAREISVFDYSQILFSALLGFLFFGQVPDAWSWLGYLVIVATAAANFLYNLRRTA